MRNGTEQPTLKESHPYYYQVQGQMAIGRRTWNNFVIFTTKGINIEGIYCNQLFCEREVLPKLVHFMIAVWHQRFYILCILLVFLYVTYLKSKLYN